VEATVEIPVQVMGKLRGTVVVPAGSVQDAVLAEAQKLPSVAAHLAGKTIRKVIFTGKLINIVAG